MLLLTQGELENYSINATPVFEYFLLKLHSRAFLVKDFVTDVADFVVQMCMGESRWI